jgi:hypothetical protein
MKLKSGVYIVIILFLSIFITNVKATIGPVKVYVSPPINKASIGTTFVVKINITDVQDLYSWEFDLKWDASMLNATSLTQGTFLNRGNLTRYPTTFLGQIFNDKGYVTAACALKGLPTSDAASGNGTLATVTFLVKATGECDLDLYGTSLLKKISDWEWELIPHVSQDGYFNNKVNAEVYPVDWNNDTIIDYYVSIVSNSTLLSNFAFNQPAKQISFNVTGSIGTTGFCNVTIPRGLLDCTNIEDWIILLDETVVTSMCTISNTTTVTFIYVPYSHSSHTILIYGTQVVREFTSLILLLILAVTTVATVLTKKIWKPKPKVPTSV